MSFTRHNTETDADGDGVERLRVGEEGFVTSVQTVNDSDEPVLHVESRFDSTETAVYVPHSVASDTGLPTVGERVYFVRLIDDTGIFIGTVADEHTGYNKQRRWDWPHSNTHLTFTENGSVTLDSHVDDPSLDHFGTLAFDSGDIELSADKNVGGTEHNFSFDVTNGNLTVETKNQNGSQNVTFSMDSGDVTLETNNSGGDDVYMNFTGGDFSLKTEEGQTTSCTASLKDGDITFESEDGTKVTLGSDLTIDTSDGTTVTVDGDTVQINGGSTPVVTDVTTTTDTDGHVTSISTVTSDNIHVN